MIENNQTKSKNSKGRGGARTGAGRKTGSATKKTREIANKAAEEGITPLEVMLFAMRATMNEAQAAIDAQRLAGVEQIAMPLGLLADAAELAKDAAPYMHPKLAAIEHTGAEGGAIRTDNTWRLELVKRADADAA